MGPKNVHTHTPNFGSLPQIILETCSGHYFSRTEAKGKGHSDPGTVRDKLRLKNVSKPQIWDSYLKS